MNSNQLYIVDEKVFSQTWEREKATHPMTTLTTGTANAAIAALAVSSDYICVDADLDTYETRGTSYLRVKLYFGDTTVNPEKSPPISNVYIICHEDADAVSTDIKAYIAAGGAHLTAPKGIKSMQTVSTNYRGHKRYATLVLLTDNVGDGYKAISTYTTTPIALTADEDYVIINPAGATVVNLPSAADVLGKSFTIMTQDIDQTITLTPDGTEHINDNGAGGTVNIGAGGEGADDNREWVLTAIGSNLWNLAPQANEQERASVVTLSGAADVTTGQDYILADGTALATLTLPAANAALVGKQWTFNTIDITAAINLTPNGTPGTDSINGGAPGAAFNIGDGAEDALAYRQWVLTCTAVGAFEVAPYSVIAPRMNVAAVDHTAPYVVSTVDDFLDVDADSGDVDITLPDTSGGEFVGKTIYILTRLTTENIVITPDGAELINGVNAAINIGNGSTVDPSEDAYNHRIWTLNQGAAGRWELSALGIPNERPRIVPISGASSMTVYMNVDQISADATAGAPTINLLPATADMVGWGFDIYTPAIGANAITVDPDGAETINGAAQLNLGGGGAAPAPVAVAAAGNLYRVWVTAAGAWQCVVLPIAV